MYCHLHHRPNCPALPKPITDQPQLAVIVQQARTIKVIQRMPGLDKIADKKVNTLFMRIIFYYDVLEGVLTCGLRKKGLDNRLSSSKLLKLRVRLVGNEMKSLRKKAFFAYLFFLDQRQIDGNIQEMEFNFHRTLFL